MRRGESMPLLTELDGPRTAGYYKHRTPTEVATLNAVGHGSEMLLTQVTLNHTAIGVSELIELTASSLLSILLAGT